MSRSPSAVASIALAATLISSAASADTFAYIGNAASNDISVFRLEPASGKAEAVETVAFPGVEKAGSSTPLAVSPWAADVHLTPDGRFLYASERTSCTISAFKVDPASGRLTPLGSVPTEKQPRGFAIDPSGHWLAAVGELSNGMSIYAIDAESGALKQLGSYPVGKQPNWVEFVSLP